MDLPVYEPREDSFLIVDAAKELVKGKILEVGFGSGYVSNELAKNNNVKCVLGVDINEVAVEYAKEKYTDKKLTFIESDLFSKVKEKFNYIICNPPYLPQDEGIIDPSLYGGKKGYEFIERLLSKTNDFLEDDGSLILLFSNLSRKEVVDRLIEENMFIKELLKEKHVGGFETLYVYKITKRKALVELNKKSVENISFFAKGKRGMIFTGTYKGKKLGIKIKNPHSEVDSVKHEANMMKKVNEFDIAPKFVFSNDELVAYEFFEGDMIEEWTNDNRKKEIITMLNETFKQLKILDDNKLDKKEMSHPHKHVLISKEGKVCLIDFERARIDLTPSNVTGFAQFITSTNYGALLKEKGLNIDKDNMITITKEYKKDFSEKSYNKILELIY